MYIDNGLLSYCWKHKLLGDDLSTTEGRHLVIHDAGLYNKKDGTFFNAKLKIDNCLFVGNVVVLENASDWYVKRYDQNDKYRNTTLLVVLNDDSVVLSDGEKIPILKTEIPVKVEQNANLLMSCNGDILCHQHIMQYNSRLLRHAWLSAMQTEFLEEESSYLKSFYEECGKDMEQTFFCAILRAFGFNVCKTEMDLLARNLSLPALEHHRDDLFQIEAFLMGQAGLLTLEPDVQCAVPEKYHKDALNEGYFARLRNEWLYLSHKYTLKGPLSCLCWHPYGSGGWKYPHVIISMLANWYYCRKMDSVSALNVKTAKEAMNLFNTHCTPYWETHFMFGAVSRKSEKHLSNDRKAWLIMAGLVPFLFFCGRLKNDEELCDRAFDFMEQVKTFSTTETKHFKKYGLIPEDAGETLALTHMKTAYCNHQWKPTIDTRECLRCRFGLQFIKNH